MALRSRRSSLLGRRAIAALALAGLVVISLPASASAQEGMSKETAAAIRASFLADLETLRGKFVGLAQAFPQDKYTWRPMEGVRSVSEVLMLAASEGYGFIPTGFGGKAALDRQEMMKLPAVSDKAQVLDHLTKGFAHAKKELEAVDPATLIPKRRLMDQDFTTIEIVAIISGDLHEHLGQMIAYARMNRIVPPWSK